MDDLQPEYKPGKDLVSADTVSEFSVKERQCKHQSLMLLMFKKVLWVSDRIRSATARDSNAKMRLCKRECQ